MIKAHLDLKIINAIKDILLQIQNEEPIQNVQEDLDLHVHPLNRLDILLILQELKSGDNGIAIEEIEEFVDIYRVRYGQSLQDIAVPNSDHQSHPVHIFKKENQVFEKRLSKINGLLKTIEKDPQHATDELLDEMNQIGQFYSHYNRKEKLFFPILERFGIYPLTRTMWADDDRIRTLYKGAKRMMEKISEIDFQYVKQAFQDMEKACKDMIVNEEYLLLPIAQSYFTEDNWLAVAKESKAFGYAVEVPKEDWILDGEIAEDTEDQTDTTSTEHFRIGGGYLTIKEANHILNNLPLEITFVDKNGIFKYFNELVESSEMMFVRTTTSIGRNVANCHPPKSLGKVMQVIRDLKSQRKSSETMWFKKKDQFVHVTYKGLFDENGEYLGILEYVQDIQPFLDLPVT